ncbi:actin-related protein 2/3 complex subunit 5 [Pavlovales sp. CCMP2436]|nr:actin-related protein 2/3 complex subunit 5 [Pavlovales sp. CCMP2436]|eukprot:CAMPEP_0179898090 /NCGR_PEP_ID=MMETSP0982-20121206/37406_1 /TAXON_ID=483367 /ORGANISM="non described non described, Strain CCMP 2436" /LENGTH=129 /DNA_ID=CAMNT_0021795269 /DNA_START=38 /DNA_END=427 /DNA_ORIENTATION=-
MEVGAENSLLDSIEQRRLGVNQSIKQGAWAEALKLALRDAPLASTSAKAKDANAAVVASAALAVREAELAVVVGVLDADEAEVLLKYVYRCLSTPSDKSALWFRWHAALVERTGPGAVVRVIAEVGRTA